MVNNAIQQQPPRISIRSNLWVVIPIGAVIVAILSANLLILNYVHIFTAILWTGTDIFMGLLLGPVLRNVSLSTRKEVVSWLSAVLVIVSVMFIQGLGILLPTNLRIYFELRKNQPDMSRIQKLMKMYVKVVAIQAAMQFVIIFIMAEFATGYFLKF